MHSRDAAQEAGYSPPVVVATTARPPAVGVRVSPAVGTLLWAGAASTLHRLRQGEGALLAINLSLIVVHGAPLQRALAQALISVLVLGLMYAFNDFYDAPSDAHNPKKDRALIAAYLLHRRASGGAIIALTLLAPALAVALVGLPAAGAVGGVLLVNVVYSTRLKGVPVVDVAWCGLWGALYAAIVGAPLSVLLVVGLMTAICHLYQTLDDRVADAASGITTTAVRSAVLSRAVLVALAVLLGLALRAPLGGGWALSALTPLALVYVAGTPRTGWLLTKVYFGVLWLSLLGSAHALG
jgi:4-hydroxybenzoate polyprenyltransferase